MMNCQRKRETHRQIHEEGKANRGQVNQIKVIKKGGKRTMKGSVK